MIHAALSSVSLPHTNVKRRERKRKMISPVIERLAAILEEENADELKSFLSAEKGFRSKQYEDHGMSMSLVHYVAGREFETAEEAEEWLSYAIAQQYEDIEKQSGVFKFRPLHCACKWGNIFGVQWLVSHGANINVKDFDGRTTYSHACESSVDTMEKLVYLKERGYILSSSDIVSAAFNQFSSSEKADEIFYYFVNKDGLSVDAIEEKHGWTPLHGACIFGSIFGMKWLLEHNADINSVTKAGQTPFMLACEGPINRSAKVRYLDGKGANCQAKDDIGQTALFYATTSYECEDDEVKDVLRYLVIEKGIDINSVDEEGMTPLLDACEEHPTVFVIEQLIELGADVFVQDENKQNALHKVAMSYSTVDKSTIDLLIRIGVDVTCQDEEGNTPYQVAEDGERRSLLRQHYDAARFSVLQRETVRPDSIKSCVVGREMAGKTTYVNSLLQLNQSPPKENDRTPGVDIHNCENEKVGKGSWWDFGAQPTFHSAHGLFFQKSNTMFNLILPIRKGDEMTSEKGLLEEGQFWCAFAKASLRTPLSHVTSLIPFMIIFNLIGFEEKRGIEVCFKMKRVARELQKLFGNTFNIELGHVIEMDCSKSTSVRMDDCRQKLKKIREKMLEAADGIPKLCHEIEKHLSIPDEEREHPLAYFLTTEEFHKWIAQEVKLVLNEDEKKVAVEYLDSSGLIINLGRCICVRPQWLCHNVIGPLLAPPWFPVAMQTGKSGKASKGDIESALTAFEDDLIYKGRPSAFVVKANVAIEVLRYLDLCIELEDAPRMYQIPALLDDSIPPAAWVKDLELDVYRGQRYECDKPIDIISPSSFVILQCRCSRLTDTSEELWKNGIKLVRIVDSKVIECLIQFGMKKGRHCIDVILRWSSKISCEAETRKFFKELKLLIAEACDERSPGVILNWFYLDSSHLQQLNEDPAIYSSSEVDKKVNEKALDHLLFSARPERRHRSSVRDLVVLSGFASGTFPPDDAPLSDDLITACAHVKGSLWENLGSSLHIDDNDLQYIREQIRHDFSRMVKVLKLWNTAKSPTVGQLLRLFELFEVNRRAIILKFESLCGSK
ncbi:death-associated protein kinase 1-like isoform X2 [Oscarella lobularis]|uniref:death-associated protein kinase 1-like isoform X2 n=1 Tax=Oscarella lobularis TaxID=121494 RepID=UPI0033136883